MQLMKMPIALDESANSNRQQYTAKSQGKLAAIKRAALFCRRCLCLSSSPAVVVVVLLASPMVRGIHGERGEMVVMVNFNLTQLCALI